MGEAFALRAAQGCSRLCGGTSTGDFLGDMMTTFFEPSGATRESGRAPELELTPPAVLDQSNLVDPVKSPPKQGWRKLVHTATRGRINPGGSRRELEEQQLFDAIRAPLRGDYRIAVMSLKGCLLYTSPSPRDS